MIMDKDEIIAKIAKLVDLKKYPIIFRAVDRDLFYAVSSYQVIDQASNLYRLIDGFAISPDGKVSKFLYLPGRFQIVVEDASIIVQPPETKESQKAVAFFPEKPRRRRKTLNIGA